MSGMHKRLKQYSPGLYLVRNTHLRVPWYSNSRSGYAHNASRCLFGFVYFLYFCLLLYFCLCVVSPRWPAGRPAGQPPNQRKKTIAKPTIQPTNQPTDQPPDHYNQSTNQPTNQRTHLPTHQPSTPRRQKSAGSAAVRVLLLDPVEVQAARVHVSARLALAGREQRRWR